MKFICFVTSPTDKVSRRFEVDASDKKAAMKVAAVGFPRGTTVSCRTPDHSSVVLDWLEVRMSGYPLVGVLGAAS